MCSLQQQSRSSSNSFFFFFFSTNKGLSKTRLSSLFSSRKKKVMKVKNPTLLHPPVCSDCYTSCAPRSHSRSLRKTKEKSLAIDPIARVFVCVFLSLSLGRHLGFLLLLLPRSHGTCYHWPLACSPLTLQLFPPGHCFHLAIDLLTPVHTLKLLPFPIDFWSLFTLQFLSLAK